MTGRVEACTQRGIAVHIESALDQAAVVIIQGARRVGKSTVCQSVANDRGFTQSVDLSDEPTRRAAERDPRSFIEGLRGSTLIDEAQLVGAIATEIKRVIDRPDNSQQFVLTGSTRLNRTGLGGSDPLPGRSASLTVRPFSISERLGEPIGGVAAILSGRPPQPGRWRPGAKDLRSTALLGGIPTVAQVLREPQTDESGLAGAATVLSRYVEGSLAISDEPVDRYRMLRFAEAVMAEPAGLLNLTRLGQRLEMKRDTARRYFDILARYHLLWALPSLRPNVRQRVTAHPKVFGVDTGVAAVTNGWSSDDLAVGTLWGSVFEAMVVGEVVSQASFVDPAARCEFWRSSRGNYEVDLAITTSTGRVIGIEVKASPLVDSGHTRGLQALADVCGDRWLAGFVLHPGEWVEEIAPGIWSVPFAAVANSE